jgi:hypothetical protein
MLIELTVGALFEFIFTDDLVVIMELEKLVGVDAKTLFLK